MSTTNKQIGKSISFIYRKKQIYINAKLCEYGIGCSEYMYIISLPLDSSVNLSYLSNELGVDPALTTKVINSLVKKEFVYKHRSENDKRSFEVSLTEKGKKIKPIIRKVLDEWMELMTKGMDDKTKESIIENLEMMVKNIKYR
ncbi:MarR family winged helix-turn-helix transcriptional regulator [Clostridium thermobutyricum]|uniref:MarR family winged helix-turn-helix transcriptional regulator n=1 Tax=Clostridium thermobutyricum TaxID=29372 RepID=UPI0018A93556|nr:MarR family transcriptional regulator [Clostridium thermobutyricum]